MAHYIDKDALVAEIENLSLKTSITFENFSKKEILKYLRYRTIQDILSLINTLEVKEVDLEKDVRQILSLYHEGIKHYDDIIKEEREETGGSDLAIKIMDGVVDARELGIQYVIDKLKAQKG